VGFDAIKKGTAASQGKLAVMVPALKDRYDVTPKIILAALLRALSSVA
jgi:hypothetical protein